MIDGQAAASLARDLLGRPQDDADRPWRLMPFPEGWLIREDLPGRGGVSKVIERSTGKIKYFPSRVAPDRILERYDSVVATAREVSVSDSRP